MKMRHALPIVLLTVAIVACGKKDAPVATTGIAPVVAAPYPAQPFPTYPGYPQTNDLASFCQYNGGQLSGNLCRFNRNFQNNSWFSISIGDFNTQVPVYIGEKVSVAMQGSARVLVNGYNYGTGSITFIAQTEGYLTLQKYTSTYNLNSVNVQTCYSSPSQRAYCN